MRHLMQRRAHTRPAAPLSASLNRNGWVWDPASSADENYMDLAFLLSQSSTATGRVGCAIVSGVRDGAAKDQGSVIVCGVNSGLYSPLKADCHAEANAIAESAASGWPLRGATCYVSKPPCNHCFSLLAVSGIARIVSAGPFGAVGSVKQELVAQQLGIECSVVRCTDERRERRERLSSAVRDWDRVATIRERKKWLRSQSAAERVITNLSDS
uniref:CMP/dCMP-type deaminase domain-containing protein n=1 Tax=uncultured organism MedDCM-OCT-S12-C54 TaxID=743665 RepID=D6PJG1_9ZZZZ|nr:hypothetical protein [uncultured organism MedDCM-OCT-S12-C54]